MTYPERIESKIGFSAIRDIVSSKCVSAIGSRYCADMAFSSDFAEVSDRLISTREMVTVCTDDDRLPLDSLSDPTPLIQAIALQGMFLPADELKQLRGFLTTAGDAEAFFRRHTDDEGASRYPRLAAIAADLYAFPECERLIDRVIDRYGNIKDNASAELAEIRSHLRQISGTINGIMRRVMARAVADGYITSDTTPSIRDGRLVLPVAPMHKRKINGIVHDESATGKTLFIEPAEVVEANNRVRELEMEERREIARILTEVADALRPYSDEILIAADILGHLDFIRAKALFAIETGGELPALAASTELEWYHACHPVLKLTLERQGKEIVPLDITLTPGARILIISGPNAGGKSVCLKTVGTIQYMAQCGLLPTVYENSHLGIFDDIFVDIGDDQSIEDDLSTYSSHLKSMKLMLSRGRESSLLLIDEFGGGTEPQIGGAIAQAILRQFNDKKMWGVITTHYQNLKHFAEDTDGLINGSMLYDRHLMQPMFKLSIGNPGSSFAIEIARKIGLPESIIDDATEIVGSDYINLDKYLLDITRDKRYWENKRSSIRQKEKKLESLLERYEHDAETLRLSRREILDEARQEAQRILDSSNASIERTIHDIKKAKAEREKTLEARKKLQEERETIIKGSADNDHPLLKKAPKSRRKKAEPAQTRPQAKREIKVGDHVKLDGQGVVGRVVEINGQKARVTFGMLKTDVELKRLAVTSAKIESGAGKTSFISAETSDNLRDRQLRFKQEIDVRGMRADEAVQAVTYFIDDALQFSASRVRILHGTGTGALRQSIRQYLATIPGVRTFHDEDVRLGGAGITVVELD